MKHLKKKKMRKFRLIKEYPGSTDLGVEVERDTTSASQFYRTKYKTISVFKSHVEDNPEYWEEVIENKFMVSTRNSAFLNAYSTAKVKSNYKCNEYEELFDSREEAEAYIFYNKPCLSLMDVLISFDTECRVSIEKLNNLVENKQNV